MPNQILIILAVSIAPYLQSLFFDFAFDDYLHIVSNSNLLSFAGLKEIWLTPLSPGNLWRPVLITSYWIQYKVTGLNPFWFHLVNLLLSVYCNYLIYIILKKVVNEKTSFVITILFSLLPIHSEVIANVTGRSELLTHAFGLSSLYLALQYSSVLSIIPFLLACLTKESAIVYFPLFLLFLKFNSSDFIKTLRIKKYLLLAWGTTIVMFIFARTAIVGLVKVAGTDITKLDNYLLKLAVLIEYLMQYFCFGNTLDLLLFL